MKNKIAIILTTIILCFFIYKITYKKNNNLLALGDSSCLATSPYGVNNYSYNNYLSDYYKLNYNKKFCKKNMTVLELYHNIKNNDNQILKDLDKASYITLMIGYDELTSYKEVTNIIKRDFLSTYYELLKILKQSTKGKIIVIGYYSNYFKNVEEINKKLEKTSTNLELIFIDSRNLEHDTNNFYNKKFFYLTNNGNKKLFELINQKI